MTDQNFEDEVIKSTVPVLVDFWAPWCGPCQMAGPIIEELAKEYEGKVKVAKMNVDENSLTPAKLSVMSIPTVVIFKGGKEVNRLVGFAGREGYVKLLTGVLKNN